MDGIFEVRVMLKLRTKSGNLAEDRLEQDGRWRRQEKRKTQPIPHSQPTPYASSPYRYTVVAPAPETRPVKQSERRTGQRIRMKKRNGG